MGMVGLRAQVGANVPAVTEGFGHVGKLVHEA